MIGGEHYLAPPARVERNLAASLERALGKFSLFSTGRDALFALLQSLPQSIVHLPDLMCHSVPRACEAAGKQVRLYAVGGDLREAGPGLPGEAGECVLVMHYFGVANDALAARARAAGCLVISDVTHMLFNETALGRIAQASDYVFGSLRKSGPFPDGAFVASRTHALAQPGRSMRQDFVTLRAAALLSRGLSAAGGFVDDENFGWLRQAEALLDACDAADYACSHLGRELLHTVDPHADAARMQANMAVLATALEGTCVLPCSACGPSPYFLCLFGSRAERDAVRAELAGRRTYPPVHWDTGWSPRPSPLSDLGLSIPCDARYDTTQMQSTANTILACLKR
jgi:hypothetical protein